MGLHLEKALLYMVGLVEEHPTEGPNITNISGTQPQAKLGQNIDVSMAAQLFTRALPVLDDHPALENRVRAALQVCLDKLAQSQSADGSWNDRGGWAAVLQSAMANNAFELADQAGGQHPPKGNSSSLLDAVPVVGTLSKIGLDAGRELLDLAAAPWMKFARAEHAKGVVEKKGKGTNSDIMKYLRTCDHLWEKEKGRRWTERVGGEGVAWCAAFVNWCLDQAGIRGTRHAWALKFAKWGRPIPGPEFGAIVVQKTSSWRHVAFVDEVNGQLKILGGNQKAATLRGPSNQVSYQPLNRKITVAYVWPF